MQEKYSSSVWWHSAPCLPDHKSHYVPVACVLGVRKHLGRPAYSSSLLVSLSAKLQNPYFSHFIEYPLNFYLLPPKKLDLKHSPPSVLLSLHSVFLVPSKRKEHVCSSSSPACLPTASVLHYQGKHFLSATLCCPFILHSLCYSWTTSIPSSQLSPWALVRNHHPKSWDSSWKLGSPWTHCFLPHIDVLSLQLCSRVSLSLHLRTQTGFMPFGILL